MRNIGFVGERYSGWRGGKSGPVWFLLRAGAISSVLLLGAALAVDWGSGNLNETFPGLPGFLWNIASGAILGTLAIGIVDDLRRDSGWNRVLHGNVLGLAESSSALFKETWNFLGCEHELTHSQPGRFPAERAAALGNWFGTLSRRQDEALHRRSDADDPAGPLPVRSWVTLESTLREAKQFAPERIRLESLVPAAAVEVAIQHFREQLQTLDPAYASRASLAQIDSVRSRLSPLGSQLAEFRGWLASLPEVEPEAAWPAVNSAGRSRESAGLEAGAVVNSASLATSLWVTFHAIGLLLEVLNYELEAGRAHPFRG